MGPIITVVEDNGRGFALLQVKDADEGTRYCTAMSMAGGQWCVFGTFESLDEARETYAADSERMSRKRVSTSPRIAFGASECWITY